MNQRPIIGVSKAGSISRLQARRAAKAVKMAKSWGMAARKSTSTSTTGRFVRASIHERYLGHFGVASSTSGRKNASGVKNRTATKSMAKKAAPK